MPSVHPNGDPFIRDHWRALIALFAMTVVLLVMLGCVPPPGTEIAETEDGYKWRSITAPGGQECLILERGIGTQYSMMGLDCNWEGGH